MSTREDKDRTQEFVNQAFSGSLALMGILIAVVGLLASVYPRVEDANWLETPFRLIIGGATASAVLAGVASALAMCQLLGKRISVRALVAILVIILTLVVFGLPVTVWFMIFYVP